MFTRLTLFAILVSALSLHPLAHATVGLGQGSGGGSDSIGSLPHQNLSTVVGAGDETVGTLPLQQASVSIIYKVVVPCNGNCNVATMTSADWTLVRDTVANAIADRLSGAAFNRSFDEALANGAVTIRSNGRQAQATAFLNTTTGDETIGTLPLQGGQGGGGDSIGSLPHQKLNSVVGGDDETVGTLP